MNPGAASPAPGPFSFEPFPGLRRHNTAGGFYGPVSIRSAASEYIPLGGAVLFWNVPNSPIGSSFGVDAKAGAHAGEPALPPIDRHMRTARQPHPHRRLARAQQSTISSAVGQFDWGRIAGLNRAAVGAYSTDA
jgi:hypothetical protein